MSYDDLFEAGFTYSQNGLLNRTDNDALTTLDLSALSSVGGSINVEYNGALTALGGPRHRWLGGPGRWRDSGMVLAGHGTRAHG